MGKRAAVIMPQTRKILEQMGEQIRLARLRRKLSLELVAERAGISRATLISIEKGAPTVSIGLCRRAARTEQYGQRPAAYCQR